MKILFILLLISFSVCGQQTTSVKVLPSKDTTVISFKTTTTTTSNTVTTYTTSVLGTKDTIVIPPVIVPGNIEGFGVDAIGGANSTTVYHVTNINASGAGSLANGIGSNKTIVFDVSGTINARLYITGLSYL